MDALLQSPATVFYLGVGAGLALGSVLGAGSERVDALEEAVLSVLLVLFWPALSRPPG